MSVNSLENKSIYTGDGDVDAFPFTFKIYLAADLVVSRVIIATGVEEVGVLNTHYTVSINGVLGGTVTTIGTWENTPITYKIVIRRVLPLTQLSTLVDNESTPAATFENGYDRDIMIAQQLQEQLDRALLLSPDQTSPFSYTDFLDLVSASLIGYNSIRGTFTSTDLVGGILTIVHGRDLDAPYAVQVTIFNNSGKQIIPGEITGGANAVAVDLSDFSVAGTWGYIVTNVNGNLITNVNFYESVKDYGAIGDGSTDDTAAIQAAMDAAPIGGKIFFPVGVYKVTSTLTPINNRLVIEGVSGQSSIVFVPPLTSDVCFQITAALDNVTFKDIHIYSGENYAGAIGVAVAAGANTITFDHCFFDGFAGYAVKMENALYARFRNCRFMNNINSDFDDALAYGIYITTVANNVNIEGCKFLNNDFAIRILGGNQVNLIGNSFEGDGASGNTFGFVSQLSFDDVTALNIIGNYFEQEKTGTNYPMMNLDGCPSAKISGNIFSDGAVAGISERYIDIDAASTNCVIENNWFSKPADYFVVAATHVTLRNNYYYMGAAELTTYAGIMTYMSIGRHLFIGRDGAVINSSSTVDIPQTLANSATPSISAGGTVWLTGGTTTITNITGGITGQKIEIHAEHAITITDGTNIFLNASGDFIMAVTDTLSLRQKADGKWYEIGRSDNT